MAFEKLSSIIEIKTEYTTRSALAIMSGREEAFAPLDQVVTTVGGQPVIPGSSLKGALRSAAESLLAERRIPICVPDAAVPKEESRNRDDYARRIGRLPACEGRSGSRRPCPVCQVFGAADLAARASFLDAKPVGTPKLIERSHVAITRDNKAAAGGKLLQLQAVDAGTKFIGTIRITNAENWHVGAVLAGLKTLELSAMGGKKSAGYGELEVRIMSITRLLWKDTGWEPQPASPADVYLKAFADLRA
jgi:CRISPR-associated RAMP protein (TIGR02581 family)